MRTRKLVDPLFQQTNYFTVWHDNGKIAGLVFVLDSELKPPRQQGGKGHEDHGNRPRHKLRRLGNDEKRKAN